MSGFIPISNILSKYSHQPTHNIADAFNACADVEFG